MPAVLPPLPKDAPRNRLALRKWLVGSAAIRSPRAWR